MLKNLAQQFSSSKRKGKDIEIIKKDVSLRKDN